MNLQRMSDTAHDAGEEAADSLLQYMNEEGVDYETHATAIATSFCANWQEAFNETFFTAVSDRIEADRTFRDNGKGGE